MSACRPPLGEEKKMKLLSSCRFLICGSIIYSQTNLKMYTCSCNVFTAEGPSERVTIVSAYRPIHCGKLFFITISFWLGILLSVSQTNVMQREMFSDYDSWLGFHYLILDQCIVMREMECCLLVWVSSTSFQTLLDIGGDGCCLLVWAFTTCFQAFAG